jgi:hypothetical protein
LAILLVRFAFCSGVLPGFPYFDYYEQSRTHLSLEKDFANQSTDPT